MLVLLIVLRLFDAMDFRCFRLLRELAPECRCFERLLLECEQYLLGTRVL